MTAGERAHGEVLPAMTELLPAAPARPAPARARDGWRTMATIAASWPRLGLLAILALSAALNIVGLGDEGYANTYYAAAVKSMLTSWHNFFFVSFDSGGFVTVDKPPLGLWIQAVSAKVFGFSGLSILLPQALAGVASVALLYSLVRRAWGPAAGLLAAAALAVTPISVVTSRNNTSDTVMVLLLLGAAWAATLAAESGRLRLLLLAGAFVGLAFNVKTLAAYLVLPGLVLIYLLGAPRRPRAIVGHLALFGLVTLAVSLAWVAVVDLTPASARPYVGSSGTNSALSLLLGYNGLARLTLALPAGVREALRFLPGDIDLDVAPARANGIGDPGLLRLFSGGLAGQASWLLPLAIVGLVAGGAVAWRRLPLDRRGGAVVLWGGWLLGVGAFFSVARFYHLYYLTLIGPGIAALAGIALAALWGAWRRGAWLGWALPPALIGAALAQVHILDSYPAWRARLATPLVATCVVIAIGLVASRFVPRWGGRLAPALAGVVVAALLVPSLTWSVISVRANNGAAWLPEAGSASQMNFGGMPGGGMTAPQAQGGRATGTGTGGFGQGQVPAQAGRGNQAQGSAPTGQAATGGAARQQIGGFPGGGGAGGGNALTVAGANWDVLDARLVSYLVANQGAARFLVATTTSTYASIFMLATDQPAMALGGYQGWDRILTPAELAALVRDGTVRFFYLGGGGGFGGGDGRGGTPVASGSQDATGDLTAWVQSSCSVVPTVQIQAAGGGTAATGTARQSVGQSLQLYDCASVANGKP